MAMHNPPHPGGIVRRQCLDALDLSVTEAAKGLGVTCQALPDLINETDSTNSRLFGQTLMDRRPGIHFKNSLGKIQCLHPHLQIQ